MHVLAQTWAGGDDHSRKSRCDIFQLGDSSSGDVMIEIQQVVSHRVHRAHQRRDERRFRGRDVMGEHLDEGLGGLTKPNPTRGVFEELHPLSNDRFGAFELACQTAQII